jgi:ketosteroid isomerase-like protein
MMKKWICGASGLLLAACAPVQSQPATSLQIRESLPNRADTESYIRRSAEQWAASDATAMATFLADEYVGVGSNGEIRSKARQLELAREPSPYRSARVDYVKFHHHGSLVIAQGAETLTPATGPDRRLVWTDTWLFRDGRWQVVASQDSVRPAEGFDAERKVIIDLRAANNLAMAAGDLDQTMRIVAPDYAIVSGSGRIVRSAEQMRAIWAEALRDRSRACVRTPRRVELGQHGGVLRAAETGEWSCGGDRPGSSVHGSYFAHWTKRSGDWKVVSDTYVSLGCRGADCDKGR